MSGKNDFFEAFKRAIHKKMQKWYPQPAGYTEVIEAAAEALEEMIVGEPTEAHISHFETNVERQWTDIVSKFGRGKIYLSSGHHGTDGEEVAVLVVRMEKEEAP